MPLLIATAIFLTYTSPAHGDGRGGNNSAALGGNGASGGAGGGGGSNGVGGVGSAQVSPGQNGSNGNGGAGSAGNAVTGGAPGAGGSGGAGGTASNPVGEAGEAGDDAVCGACTGGIGAGGGGGGGDGFNGAALTGVAGPIVGGSGGNGGNVATSSPFGGDGGSGGGGGAGAVIVGGGSTATSANITGGNGGNGGAPLLQGGAGFGGGGGSGLVNTGVNLSNSFMITGGNGGNGAAGAQATHGRSGGNGGAGILGSAFTLNNSGVIQGGSGGTTGANSGLASGGIATGGAGIEGADLQIINTGTIAGGLSGNGSTRANAVSFTGGANSLELRQGWNLIGNVNASGGANALILGGDVTDLSSNPAGTSVSTVFDVSQLGPNYQGFTSFSKTGASVWQLVGTTSGAVTPWNVSGGTLQIAVAGSLGPVSATLTLDGGTLRTTASLTTARSVTLGAASGIFESVGATTLTLGGTISGVGALTKTGTGTLTLTADSNYTGGTTISAGTLQVGNGGTSGSIIGNVLNNSALAFNRGNAIAYAGTISGTGTVNQIGSGTTTLTGAASSVGSVNVQAGTLAFAQNGLFQSASHATQAGAATSIGGASRLSVAGAFTQASGSVLGVAIGGNNPAITAQTAAIDGALNITGFAAGAPTSASALTSTQFTVLQTTGGIAGEFAAVDFGAAASAVDYLTLSGAKTANSLDYNIGFGLTWSAGPALGNGVFTLANPTDTFDVDVMLADQAPSTTGWNGRDLTKNGAGTLALSAINTYTGQTIVNGGTLQTGIANAFAPSSAVTVNAGATLDLNNFSQIANNLSGSGSITLGTAMLTANNAAIDTTFTGVIGGAGSLNKNGTGALTLTGASTYSGGTTISAGTLQIGNGGASGSIIGNVLNNGTLAFNRSNAITFAGAVTGSGTIRQIGSGVVELTGDSSAFAGATRVEAGMLAVNGALGGTLDVLTGATLAGTGTVGATTVASGGTLAPGPDGGAFGTLTVNGNLTFAAGSTYAVGIDPAGGGDLTRVTGNVAINGGQVAVAKQDGAYLPGTRWTIISADSMVSGTFDTLTENLPYVGLSLSYDPAHVYLDISRNNQAFCLVGFTSNQCATANGVESLGQGQRLYDIVASQTSAQAAAFAFDQLSGEIHASAKTSLIEDSRFVREAAMTRIRAAFDGVGVSPAPVAVAYGAGGPILMPASTDRFAVWGQGFGSWGHTDSDGNAARLSRSTGGFLIGADAPVFDSWRLGVITGYSHTSFDANDRRSSGSSDNYHLGLYGGTQWRQLGFRSGLAYTWHDIDTSRSATFPGFTDRLKAGYNAGTFQAFGELGYRIDTPVAAFEPFVNLAYVNLDTGGFAEQGGLAALSARSQSTDTTFTTLGVRASTDVTLGGMDLTARGMLGWKHAFGDTVPLSTQTFAGSNAFTVAGVPIAQDSAVIEAGLDLRLSPLATLGLSYSGQVASSAQQHGFKANLSIRF
ncbi:autotransporter domain-containing protein [Achromobacter sp. NPDC058515]|uniref:autotransporter domain-containing protein n=1 Tax=Achromobacter sp. NPDC058515 TaxID=3346533 RepID=UPI00365BA823